METYRTLEELDTLESREKEDYESEVKRKIVIIPAVWKAWREKNENREWLKREEGTMLDWR